MSCHRIGLGMNSVVEKSIEMFENEEIDIIVQAIKNHSTKNKVHDQYSELLKMCDCYCGNCLRKLHQEHRICVDRNRYDVVTHYLCEDCYQHLVYEESILNKHIYVEKTA